jgi:hypothetical protein
MMFFERVYAHKGVEAAHIYGAFMYILAMVCEGLKVECVDLNVGTIKKFATGKGNATKEEMIAAARSCGFNPVDDNEADALAILFVGLHGLKFQKNKRYCLAKEKSGTQSPGFSLASEIFLIIQHITRDCAPILFFWFRIGQTQTEFCRKPHLPNRENFVRIARRI